MNFSVFEGLAGSQYLFSLTFGSLFAAILVWRFSSNVINQYKRLQEGDSDSPDPLSDFSWNLLWVFTFLAFCGGFLYLTY